MGGHAYRDGFQHKIMAFHAHSSPSIAVQVAFRLKYQQGTLQGIAGAFVFPLTVCRLFPLILQILILVTQASLPSQFFKKKRAFATGIVLSGSTFGLKNVFPCPRL
jgi:hypothetical protein